MSTAPQSPGPAGVAVPHVWPTPGDTDVQVWWTTTAVPAATILALRALLDDRTRSRVDAMVRDVDRTRSILAHGLMRRVVSACTGQPPEAIALGRACAGCGSTEHGKPFVVPTAEASSPPQFNLAHSGSAVVVALASAGRPIGVDVEMLQAGFDWNAVRRHVFTGPEWQATAAAPDPSAARFALWARKEAAAKATGLGLSVDLSKVEVTPDASPGGARRSRLSAPGRDHHLLVIDLALLPGTAAAVAVVDDGRPAPQVTVVRADLAA